MMEYVGLLKDFGPLIGIVLFFIWRDWKREDGLVERIKDLETFNTKILTTMIKENSGVIATNTEQLRLANTVLVDFKARNHD